MRRFPIVWSLAAALLLTVTVILPLQAQSIEPSLVEKAKAMGYDTEALKNMATEQMQGAGASSPPVLPFRSGSIQDSLLRNPLSDEQLMQINPTRMEKLINQKIEREGRVQDVRGYTTGGMSSMGMGTMGGSAMGSGIQSAYPSTTGVDEFMQAKEIPYEKPQPIEYEIVIADGKYIKRALPVIFGREIFSSKNLTFQPNYNMPTPQDYLLAAADELVIEVWGASQLIQKQKITPDGTISLKGIGPIHVSGLTVEQAQSRIGGKISQIMGGAHSKVILGQMRTIQVNLVGEVEVPGTYSLPSLATAFNALYAAGGVNRIGSLRNIKVYRRGQEVAVVDVYDYLINGVDVGNVRLEDNDMIIISPYDSHVSLTGHIKRERVYEMKKGETLEKLIEFAGGFTGDAYSENINVLRKTGRQLSIQTVARGDFAAFTLFDGDSVVVDQVIQDYANRITIAGAIWRPGDYQLSEEVSTLSQLIEKAEGLRGDEFAARGQITRRKADFTYEMIAFDVREAAAGTVDIALVKEDVVYIPNIMELRESYTLEVKGEVNYPGIFPFTEGMTIEDIIVRSGGFKESASFANIEVARRIKDPHSTTYTPRTADLYNFGISGDLTVDPKAAGFVLQPFDEIFIRRSPGYSEQQNVIVSGEVLFGGNYVLASAGERISDVIQKAGGLTPEAYVRGGSMKRRMTPDELAQLESIIRLSTNTTAHGGAVKDNLGLNINEAYPVGVNIEYALAYPGSSEDLILRDGDQIMIPKLNSTVKISGAVLYPNTVTYKTGSLKQYISQAGGFSENARRRPYVIYMNGMGGRTRGFMVRNYPTIEPGCHIIVPIKTKVRTNSMATVMGMMTSMSSLAAVAASIANIAR